jgi:hypothetical protein
LNQPKPVDFFTSRTSPTVQNADVKRQPGRWIRRTFPAFWKRIDDFGGVERRP